MHSTNQLLLNQATQNHNIKKYSLCAFLIIIAFISITLSWSYLLTVRAEKTITQWIKNNTLYNNEQAKTFESRLNNALKLNPYNANTYLALASLFEIKAKNTNNIEHSTLLNLAEQHYIKAITQRPTYGLAWAKLSTFYNASYFANQHSTLSYKVKFEAALIKAITLEPFERETQKLTIPLILEHWSLISRKKINEQQAKSILRFAVTHRSTKHLTLRQVKKFDKFDLALPLIKEEKLLLHYKNTQNQIKNKKQNH